MGKWPSCNNPALMQQIAINISTNSEKYSQPIFSVNGPPGTGKTTLLKEIVAANVVERANFLCRYEKADDAFEKAYFEDGPTLSRNGYKCYDYFYYHYYKLKDQELAKYAMLVASCNNAAVENITKELPNSRLLLDNLSGEDMSEIAELFDVSKTEDFEVYEEQHETGNNKRKNREIRDVYFSYPAQKLKKHERTNEDEIQWGLISAPMGKMSNVRNYYDGVLKTILCNQLKSNEKIEERHERYQQSKADFQRQYKKVKGIQEKLDAISRLPKNYRELKKQYLDEIQQCKKKIEQETEKCENYAKSLHEMRARRREIELLFSKSETILNERVLAQNLCTAEIDMTESEINTHSDKLMELERGRRLMEIIFAKWLKTERLFRIAELKDAISKMRARLALMNEKRTEVSESVMQAQKQLHQCQQKIECFEKNVADLTRKQCSSEQEIIVQNQKISDLNKRIDNEALELKTSLERYKKEMEPLDALFWEKLLSKDERTSTDAQLINPWITADYNRAREKLFYLALRLHKDFILSSKACRNNFVNLGLLWKFRKGKTDENDSAELCKFSLRDKENSLGSLLNTLFLLTPVISTTFASVGRFLGAVCEPGVLGTLIIDEAGQASPHFALGALWRCRRAIVVGDPKQVEPVVTEDVNKIKAAFLNNPKWVFT
jgi:hypothetical protein